MTTKRRSMVAASPEARMRSQKRRKVSDDDIVDPDGSNAVSSPAGSELGDEAETDGSSVSQDEQEESEVDFEGDTLQTAQDKIMTELARLKDSDGEEVAYPFIGKPDRNLYRDYYEIIQHPVSIRTIQKQVRGTDSRKKPSKTTAFSTWESFEEEVSYLWRNAREYNEDGSDISVLAGMLEVNPRCALSVRTGLLAIVLIPDQDHFKRRVAEARKLVPDSIQVDGHPEMPRIKLKMAARDVEPGVQRLTLKMAGQTSETPNNDDQPSSGLTVDNESLKRQQELVRTGSANQELDSYRTRSLRRHAPSPRSSVTTTPSTLEQSQNELGGREASHVLKTETRSTSSQHAETRPSHGPDGDPLDSTTRSVSNDDANSALIRNVQIITHPSLSLHHNLCLDIPPSSTVSQQTITINLPATHNLVTVRPTISAGTSQRHVKLVALMGMQQLHPTSDPSTLAFDIQLHPGTTKLDLEAIAGPPRGVPKTGFPGSDIDYERTTVFFNLLR
ncbi:hypothetical protein N7462_008769 [Penicillium macrosclerotiorum]|uniref:uncharacterized protein n=1 Tax=Penicillium macrosclerotiorum TaxID=303699 RepID=UPI002546BFED|nr:uncharacterized protein N7462_008769 [Penicillium macrosclerotiorum]KAJ5675872.1 hypothetical protein N7462_008769 [Penicillium macrosclerotiorum]